MRRRLNFKLLLVTLAVLIVAGGAFHAVHVWQVDRNVASLLAYARDAKKANKIDQELSLYEQYLKYVPNDLDVQEEFAAELDRVAQSPADRNRVVALYQALLFKSADRVAARNRLVENLIQLGRYEAAASQLGFLRPDWPDPAEVEHKRGWCLDADGKPAEAVDAFRKAVQLDPKRVNSWLQLAEALHHRLARDEDAKAALDDMIKANPESATAFLARFRYNRMLGRDAAAAKDLDQARRLAANDADVILAACQSAQQKGDFDSARELVAQGTKLYPTNEAMIRELAALELRQGNRKLALEVIEAGVKALGDKTQTGELQVFRADLLIDAGKTKEAAAIVASLRQQGLAPALPDFLQARLLMEDQKWSEALALLEKARNALNADPYWNSRVNALIGICAGRLGDGERQIAALLEAAKSDPQWAALNLSLGQAYLEADNIEQALLFLKPLHNDPQAPRGTQALIARALFRQAMLTPEKDRRWQEVDAAVALASKSDPGSLDVALLRANVLQAQRKAEAARVILANEVKKRTAKPAPTDLAAWIALADLDSRGGDYDQANETLQEAGKLFGDRAAIRLAKARMLVLRGKADDRDAIKALGDDVAALSPEDRGRLSRDLAELWLGLGDNATARVLLVRAADEMPGDLRSRALLIDLDLQDGKLDDARKWLKEMQATEGPNGQQSAFAGLLVRVEEAFGDPPALRKLLDELKKSRRGDGRVELVEARIYDRLGESEAAQQKLINAVNSGQRSPRILQRLVKTLTERQDFDQLPWAIRLIEDRGPLPRDVGRAAVETALAKKDVQHARELLGPINFESIRDYRDLLWLARTYAVMGDRTQVERSLRRAVAAAPYTPDTWVALAHFLVGSGKRPQAIELVAEIDRSKAPTKSRPIIKARVQQELGNLKDADAAFEAAVLARPSDFVILLAAADHFRQSDQPTIAEALYKKVLKPTMATPPEIAARARRGLALTTKSPAQASEILTANKSRNEVADVRLGLFLQGQDPARRDDAIAAFEKTQTRGAFTADESFWLAQLLEAAGKHFDAKERLAALVADDKDTPQMLVFFADSLIKQGKPDAAEPIVSRLVMREPGSPRTVAVQSKLAELKKKST